MRLRQIRFLIIAIAWLPCAGAALAEETTREVWPEASAFIQLQPELRAYLDASYATGKEASFRTLDLTAALDWSLKPLLRPELLSQDWQRSRFLWLRTGYTYVGNAQSGERPGSRAKKEDRLHLALYGKALLPAEVLLEGRARADLRWIDGNYSTRYRFRLEVSREFTVAEHAVTPYGQAEAFYDTRYDGWSRRLLQAGADWELTKAFRLELYLARQSTLLPSASTVSALGLVAKYYR